MFFGVSVLLMIIMMMMTEGSSSLNGPMLTCHGDETVTRTLE